VVNPQRIIEPLTAQEQVLCAFPGIGPKTAKEILKRASSLAWGLDWLTDMSETCPKIIGVDKGIKSGVKNTMQLDPGNKVAVIAE
jgi:hypothetical protein